MLTDNGTQFSPRASGTSGTARHIFARVCEQHGIEHRLTKPRHPWTNGQVERMNRTIKDATVRRYHYDSHDQLRAHLQLFLDAYNYGRRLKTLRGLTPYEFVCKAWTKSPLGSGSIRHTSPRDRPAAACPAPIRCPLPIGWSFRPKWTWSCAPA